MKILVINASPKNDGSLSTLLKEASKSAQENGAEVEEIHLVEQDIGYCRFCMTCYNDRESEIGPCVQDDDMNWILPKLKQADGYIMGTQLSSSHANAIMKTFIERCKYTAGSSKGKFLWLKGIPTSRFTDRERFAVAIVTAGIIPSWLSIFSDTATKEIKELSNLGFNAQVIGKLFAGEQFSKGLQEPDLEKARTLGKKLSQKKQTV